MQTRRRRPRTLTTARLMRHARLAAAECVILSVSVIVIAVEVLRRRWRITKDDTSLPAEGVVGRHFLTMVCEWRR